MNKMLTAAALSLSAILSGCASTSSNIIPKSGGTYEVIATGTYRSDALKEALESARDTCEERNMRHVVSAHSIAYDSFHEWRSLKNPKHSQLAACVNNLFAASARNMLTVRMVRTIIPPVYPVS